MARIIVFGTRDLASLAHFYLQQDSPHEVVAFSTTKAFLPQERHFEGLPVVAFEDVERQFAPDTHRFFAPMSHQGMNRRREEIYRRIKSKNYRLISYVSSLATSFSNVEVGENCFVLEDNTIQPFVRIGDNTVLWSGNHIGHHSVIGDHVFFTSHVVLSGRCRVENHAFLGVNSTIRDGVRIGEGSLIGMGACVTGDTDPWSVYMGVPAKRRGRSGELREERTDGGPQPEPMV